MTHQSPELTPASATQVQHPWKATVRTVFQFLVALAALAPFVAGALPPVAAVGTFLAGAAVVTRVMAMPQVNEFLLRFVPWLAADKT